MRVSLYSGSSWTKMLLYTWLYTRDANMPLRPTKKLPLHPNMNLANPLCPLCCHGCFRHGSTHSGKEESKITSTEFFGFTLSSQKVGQIEEKNDWLRAVFCGHLGYFTGQGILHTEFLRKLMMSLSCRKKVCHLASTKQIEVGQHKHRSTVTVEIQESLN